MINKARYLCFIRRQPCCITGQHPCDALQTGDDYTTCVPVKWTLLRDIRRTGQDIRKLVDVDSVILELLKKWQEEIRQEGRA